MISVLFHLVLTLVFLLGSAAGLLITGNEVFTFPFMLGLVLAVALAIRASSTLSLLTHMILTGALLIGGFVGGLVTEQRGFFTFFMLGILSGIVLAIRAIISVFRKPTRRTKG
jgi:hypothetical protein